MWIILTLCFCLCCSLNPFSSLCFSCWCFSNNCCGFALFCFVGGGVISKLAFGVVVVGKFMWIGFFNGRCCCLGDFAAPLPGSFAMLWMCSANTSNFFFCSSSCWWMSLSIGERTGVFGGVGFLVVVAPTIWIGWM